MKIQLIEGSFDKQDALNLLSKIIKVKIDFHESKIDADSNAEDVRMREQKIKKLQNNLMDLRNQINDCSNGIVINASIEIE
jgi:Spy/CpxP family protein refolding chaperone